jgi:hypothetical protein
MKAPAASDANAGTRATLRGVHRCTYCRELTALDEFARQGYDVIPHLDRPRRPRPVTSSPTGSLTRSSPKTSWSCPCDLGTKSVTATATSPSRPSSPSARRRWRYQGRAHPAGPATRQVYRRRRSNGWGSTTPPTKTSYAGSSTPPSVFRPVYGWRRLRPFVGNDSSSVAPVSARAQAGISPEPRAISSAGTTSRRGRRSSPSIRSKANSAARWPRR